MNWIDLITNVTGLAAAVSNLAAIWAQQRPGGRQRHPEPPAAPPPDETTKGW